VSILLTLPISLDSLTPKLATMSSSSARLRGDGGWRRHNYTASRHSNPRSRSFRIPLQPVFRIAVAAALVHEFVMISSSGSAERGVGVTVAGNERRNQKNHLSDSSSDEAKASNHSTDGATFRDIMQNVRRLRRATESDVMQNVRRLRRATESESKNNNSVHIAEIQKNNSVSGSAKVASSEVAPDSSAVASSQPDATKNSRTTSTASSLLNAILNPNNKKRQLSQSDTWRLVCKNPANGWNLCSLQAFQDAACSLSLIFNTENVSYNVEAK
jgi:hypothetical protein